MRSRRFASLSRFVSSALLAAVCQWSGAAELGDAAVSSYIGQPLAAEIELTGLADPGAVVTVRNASMDVYKGANIAISPVLPTLSLNVVRRDNRQFLRLSSTRAVDAGYLHLFLELSEGGKANVRGTTLWLSPDPAPKPPPAPVVARPVTVPVPAPPVSAPARPMPAPALTVPAPVPQPPPVARDSEPPRKPVREITLTGKPASACTQNEEQVKACAATEYKNGLLSAQVVELEEKVRQLQMVIDANAASAATASGASASSASAHAAGSADASAVANAAAAAASASAHKPAIPPPPPKPSKPAKHEGEGVPWLLIGGGIGALVLLGGVGWFLMKRRKQAAPATGSFMSRLAGRFKGKAKSAPEAAAPDADSA
ncbi:FimV family protein [Massilia sp. CF038]|uniref:type IV pilus assembly protein FimV n=1 Tax=Massilia sp. CF038 TaxID=1881045 RepID=UPI000922EC16|nr:hypothetical protein [Massilia sp. CF038]SHH16454.1 hypothetical protein SAMN05428948_3107 [Massilia sp. CF038]